MTEPTELAGATEDVGVPAVAPPAEPPRPPSPPWYGGVAIGLVGVMSVIILTYTLLDWEWQQDLGWWNYAVTIALIPVTSVMVRRWQPDLTR